MAAPEIFGASQAERDALDRIEQAFRDRLIWLLTENDVIN